ncbi:MAG: DoxX family protein [Brevibacillus sp.]|nr:DoxX family protein [Brevibacillus sp.]
MKKAEWSTFILRIVVGTIFLVHGLAKIKTGLPHVAAHFSGLGLPGQLAYPVVLLEVAGGALLIAGMGTRLVSGLFVLLMLGAIVTVKARAGFLGSGQGAGYEFDLILLAASLHLCLNGSRVYAVERLFTPRQE